MRIAVLGCDGFVGRAIALGLDHEHQVIGINHENYDHEWGHFDLFINANGNSKKYWASIHQREDFDMSVRSVYQTMFNFSFDKYLYISSIDATRDSIYGFHKRLAEQIVREYNPTSHYILRLSSVIGPDSRKGVVHDIANGLPVYLTANSTLNLISTKSIVYYIKLIIAHNEIVGHTRSAGSLRPISVEEIGEVLAKTVNYADILRFETYNEIMDFADYHPEEYLREFYIC